MTLLLKRPINIELFPCAGGMAKGFRDSGVVFDIAIELASNHCDSYEQNLGHRPICMDARDFLRLLKAGLQVECRLLVADPPCTPWSRSGKREGIADPRDMLQETCEIIRILRPHVYLIGNVPGLDDGPNLATVQRVIGGLHREGYCTADFARLDAANYGVPQHRIRPFWFGHLSGPCIRWPEPTHGDPDVLRDQLTLPGVRELIPWMTCGQALGHLPTEELGRPVKLRKRSCNGKQHGTVVQKPARVVGTSNLSDGNVILPNKGPDLFPGDTRTREKHKRLPKEHGQVTVTEIHSMSHATSPAKTITRNTHGDGTILVSDKHPASSSDAPAHMVGSKARQGQVMTYDEHHPPSRDDRPANVMRAGFGDGGGATRTIVLSENRKHAAASMDQCARTIRGGGEGHSPPQFVLTDSSNHPASDEDHPAMTIKASDGAGAKRAMRTRDIGRVGQGMRVGDANQPCQTVTAKPSRVGAGEAHVLEWPWDRPSTTVQADDRLAPPGHHDEDFAVMSLDNAIVISEKAATILQGFPEDWKFIGKTKKERWSQIGQAMPPPLAEPVARSVVEQLDATSRGVPAVAPVVPIDQARKQKQKPSAPKKRAKNPPKSKRSAK